MKQKFTLSIADLQVSIITDAPAAEVEKIRGILDRKMREIYLKSRCPKTEAAMLCAMEFVSERSTHQERIAELEERCDKYATVLDTLRERDADHTAELERLRAENAILRSLITTDQVPANVSPDPISPTEFFAKVADAQNETAPAEDPAPESAEDIPTDAPRKPRSRVGSMFDLLSFNEAD